MKRIITLVSLMVFFGCKSDKKTVSVANQRENETEVSLLKPKDVLIEGDLTLNVYDFDGFEPFLNKKDDKTYVINFWATWCKPCIAELPSFEQIQEKYKGENVEVVLVSLDFPRMYRSHVIPFIKDNNLKSSIMLLDDPKQNDWIPRVNEEWSGAIPATIVYNKEKKMFFEQSFEYAELENTVQQFLK
ncbi:redoxin domain-containing protein [Flavobacteriaceae bacterium R38]|nr:redoxin domain-containing protein [Flavobacteriaceae bacterium R38]